MPRKKRKGTKKYTPPSKRKKVIGFYTDERKRVRPITAPKGTEKLKNPLTRSSDRKPILDEVTATSFKTLQNKVDDEFIEECYKRAKRKLMNPLFIAKYIKTGESDEWLRIQGKKLVDEVKEEMKEKYGIYPSKEAIEYMYEEIR